MFSRVDSLLEDHISRSDTQWSLGTFGGIAEFSRDPDETVELDISEDRIRAVTSRGGIVIDHRQDMRPFASESVTRDSWSHRVALCLREDVCAMNGRSVLTELGHDDGAIRLEDRHGVLFDLGLAARQSDLCIRIVDEDMVARLRTFTGRHLFEPGNPAMGIILAANPHRVFVSRIGRIEVYQPIPSATGKSPDGPHTHLLPQLLRSGRTHPATEPVPEGWVPCGHFYPAHPTKNALGEVMPFRDEHHDAFQALLDSFGCEKNAGLKKLVVTSIAVGKPVSNLDLVLDRDARTSIRITLRQLKAAGHSHAALRPWITAFDRSSCDGVDETDDLYHPDDVSAAR